MNSLRAKLIALQVGAILVVVSLATWLTSLMLHRPDFSEGLQANAAQIGLLVGQLQGRPFSSDGPSLGLQDKAADGGRLWRFTLELRSELARRGLPADAEVMRPPGSPWPVVSLTLPEHKQVLVAPVAVPPPPPTMFPVVIGWMLLIAMGATAVSVAVVYRLTQPLVLVERSVAKVGVAGDLPLLPETGPEEVRVTAKAINLLSTRLKQAMESRMRMVAAAGHDLRTPMTRMRLRAEFLSDPDREKWVADLDELEHIADSAISLVREETAADRADPVRLDQLLHEVVEELCELGMDLRLGRVTAAEVVIRPLSLKRALRNLLVNAATHGKGAVITLRNTGEAARIEIADRGSGIPEELLQRATEPFFRVDPARSSGRGAGLGLAIAHEIVLRNGGQLSLANAPDGGGLIQAVIFPICARWPAQGIAGEARLGS